VPEQFQDRVAFKRLIFTHLFTSCSVSA